MDGVNRIWLAINGAHSRERKVNVCGHLSAMTQDLKLHRIHLVSSAVSKVFGASESRVFGVSGLEITYDEDLRGWPSGKLGR